MMQSEDVLRRTDVTKDQRAQRASTRLLRSEGIPSAPLLGALPIRRVIPQDVHSLLDYANGILVAWAGLTSRKRKARVAGAVLGTSIISVSLVTDYRLSLAKVIPIEVHEALDYIWSAAVIAAPFALGYQKRAPITTLVQVLSGAGTILGSLFTDYRAESGVGHELPRSFRGERSAPRAYGPLGES